MRQGGAMDNERWWAGIIRAVTSGLGLYGLFALLLWGFAMALIPSNLTESAKLAVWAWTGAGGVAVLSASFIILWRRPSHLADQVALRQQDAEVLQTQLDAALVDVERYRLLVQRLQGRRQPDKLEASEDDDGN